MMQGAALQHKPGFMLQFYFDKLSVISLYRHIYVQIENLGSQMCGASLRLTGLRVKWELIILKPG